MVSQYQIPRRTRLTNCFVTDAHGMMLAQRQAGQNPPDFGPAGFGQQDVDLVSILAGLNNRINRIPAASAPELPYGKPSDANPDEAAQSLTAQNAMARQTVVQDAFNKLGAALQEAHDLTPTFPNPSGQNVHAAAFTPNASTQQESDEYKHDQNVSNQTGFAYQPAGNQGISGPGSLNQNAFGNLGHGNNIPGQNQYAQDMSHQNGYPASNFNGQPVHGPYDFRQNQFNHNALGQKPFVPDAHGTFSGLPDPRTTNQHGLGQNSFFQGPFNQTALAHQNQGGHPGFNGPPQGFPFPNAFAPHNRNGAFANPLTGNAHNSMLNGQYTQQISQDGTECRDTYPRPKALFGRGMEAHQVAVQEKWAVTQYSINPVLDTFNANVSCLSRMLANSLADEA
jgi:hypothetical protein